MRIVSQKLMTIVSENNVEHTIVPPHDENVQESALTPKLFDLDVVRSAVLNNLSSRRGRRDGSPASVHR